MLKDARLTMHMWCKQLLAIEPKPRGCRLRGIWKGKNKIFVSRSDPVQRRFCHEISYTRTDRRTGFLFMHGDNVVWPGNY